MGRRTQALPTSLAGRVFGREQAIAAGLTDQRLHGPAVRRVFRGMYADAALRPDLPTLLAAASLLLPAGGAIAGAHAVHHLELPRPPRPRSETARADALEAAGMDEAFAALHAAEEALLASRLAVVVPAGRPLDSRVALDVSEVLLRAGDVITHRGVPVLRPARLLLELAADRWSLRDLLAIADAALHRGVEDKSAFLATVEWGAKRRGIRVCRQVVAYMDGRAESPGESWLRLILLEAGLPRPEVNMPLITGIGELRPDLSYRRERLAVEYDGRPHADAVRRSRDESRRQAMRALGWEVLTFTSEDVLRRPGLVVQRVSRELRLRAAA